MAIATLKNNLVTNLESVSGIVKVFGDAPGRNPERSECPCIAVEFRNPSATVKPLALGMTQYHWYLRVRLFLYPAGVETAQQKEQDIEPFVGRLVAKVNANNSLQGTAATVKFDSNFDVGYFDYLAQQKFYGLTWDFEILDNIAETYAT